MSETSEILAKLKQINDLISQDKADNALKVLEELKFKYPKHKAVIFCEHGTLIEVGSIYKDEKNIIDGINKGKSLLDKGMPTEDEASIHYNIANGYMSIFGMEPHESILSIMEDDNLQNAKYHFRQSIKSNPVVELKASVLVNYGNCLNMLGRSLDALYCYDDALQINPNYSMAIGNRAIAKAYFAGISGAYREISYIEAYQEIKSIIDKEDVFHIGGISANESFKKKLLEIENLFEDKSILSCKFVCDKNEQKHSSPFEKEYYDFYHKHRLFLNFHTGSFNCRNEILDSAFISIVTNVNDNDRFYSLAKKINDIKEDFLISKLLLVQSQVKRDDFDNISLKVAFANTLDYANFNIYNGLLKSSFRTCYNILDKIAFFINDYLNLGMKEYQINFDSIWWDDPRAKDKKLKNMIKGTDNISLYALYDVYLDLDNDKRLKNLRNSITHRKLTIYDSVLTDWDSKEEPENIGYNTMMSETIKLIKLVKSVIIYLMNFVEIEENKKREKFNGKIMEMYVDTSQFI
jgi:hypothetical protein